ncbi:MAG: hypothetical protein MI746_11860 [Pseudomonadales bacterium]|nr:hypothetical protein [Pseudomonadales bacterium]
MIKKVFGYSIVLLLLTACSTVSEQAADQGLSSTAANYGLLLMAHGGTSNWNAAVLDSVDQLRGLFPVEVAFGMADAGSLERSVRSLEQQGVEHVGVVRLFISGESWLERTRQILGMEAGAPSKAEWNASSADRPPMHMPMGFWQIETDLSFHLSEEGLAEADEMDGVLLNRLARLSENPGKEVALVLAHGPADDAEDQRWVSKISERTQFAKKQLGLHDVKVFTLREDWAPKRKEAESRIRAYVEQMQNQGFSVLVVPYRVQGFGPYAEVLAGLNYRADELGLLPHSNVDQWIRSQALLLEATATDHHRALVADAR